MGSNAVAGPSSEGALPRKPSQEDQTTLQSPSSAPPTPSVISVTHPSQFIHTHHPRRGSMTPLGLNLISPVPPTVIREGIASTSRSVGFQPGWSSSEHGVSPPSSNFGYRRGSGASTTSTLTQTRPPPQQQQSHQFYPPNWNSGRRRSSLTPSAPSLAAVSPTRAVVSGKSSRPVSSDGSQSTSNRLRSVGDAHSPDRPNLTMSVSPGEGHGRRGSLPHFGHGGWSKGWNPSLPPPRGSVGDALEDGQLPDSDFKFGSVSGPTSAAQALKQVELSPGSGRRASLKRKEEMDVFEQAEEEEAERQRRAFMAATFGADGKRARDRLSIGAQSGQGPSASSAAGTRRQSLMLWERMGKGMGPDDSGPISAPPFAPQALLDEEIAPRRGSLPMAIPGSGLGRSSSRRSHREAIKESTTPVSLGADQDDDDECEESLGDSKHLQPAPKRPLPPLLPLSDPGPRLLPSTLALHRANHLLQSRNLQSDPLPHPLPPSLHPPDPVDVAEFDIDFILAGSQAQLGGQGQKKNAPVDVLRNASSPQFPTAPTLHLGVDEEDTFAKFVGEFDDEYGDRRGEWTFRACASSQPRPVSPLDPLDVARMQPRAEWWSSGAGKYEIYANGEVRSLESRRAWRVCRLGRREYELEKVATLGQPSSHDSSERYALVDKMVHRDQGGVKLPYFDASRQSSSGHQPSSSTMQSTPSSSGTRSFTEQQSPVFTERKERVDSEASTVTMTPAMSSSAPFHNALAAFGPSKKKRHEDDKAPSKDEKAKSKSLSRQRSKDDAEIRKDADGKKGLGQVLKRGFFSSIKHSSMGGSAEEKRIQREQREERERERAQAHTWSGQSNVHQPTWFSGSSRGSDAMGYRTPSQQAISVAQTNSNHSAASSSDDSRQSARWSSADTHGRPAPSSATSGEEHLTSERQAIRWREGTAWKGVPAEAVAMIIPLEEIANVRPTMEAQSPKSHPMFAAGPKQVLLVWYVPFNSDTEDLEARPSTASSKASASEPSSLSSTSGSATQPSSLPKLQKLLRRRASRDSSLKKEGGASIPAQAGPRPPVRQGSTLPPLPFRSFRVVARLVTTDELRSEQGPVGPSSSDTAASPFDSWNKRQNVFLNTSTAGPTSFNPSPSTQGSPAFHAQDDKTTQAELTGRDMPTVIAVCHSRSQGVEFVLEGLDRLGLCKGDSAWGPTGYEEWRGTGLSEKGRELLDILWAGCTGVMGLTGV
ncbi:hypothetical protein IAU60_002170 [Kwoniella sp. DSM 27419]